MSEIQFEEFITLYGKDILRFCRITSDSDSEGDDLYQDTLLKMWEHHDKLDISQNIKSYALSVAILLWRNKKRKFAWRKKIAPTESFESYIENGKDFSNTINQTPLVEQDIIKKEEIHKVQNTVARLPEKYRITIYLFYSADMSIKEIASCMKLTENTVKTRLRRAKNILKQNLTEK